MKISKISLILLSGLLVTQATLPMENQTNSTLKKAQKAGKIALRIGAGTATFGVYALLGTAALTSWGITLGAAALSLARFLTPKAPKSQAVMPPEAKTLVTNTQKTQVKRPQVTPKIKKKTVKPFNRASMCTQSIKAATMVAVVKKDVLNPDSLEEEKRMTREQAAQVRQQKKLKLQAIVKNCKEQKIQWQKDYTRTFHAERPRYEGPYQDMIGIDDGDLEDMRNELHGQINAQVDYNLQQAGYNELKNKLQALARRSAQEQMHLPNKI